MTACICGQCQGKVRGCVHAACGVLGYRYGIPDSAELQHAVESTYQRVKAQVTKKNGVDFELLAELHHAQPEPPEPLQFDFDALTTIDELGGVDSWLAS